MPQSLLRVVFVASLSIVQSCTFDTAIPERAQRGGVTGRLDLQEHVSPDQLAVVLVNENNSQTTQRSDAEGHFTFSDLAPGQYFLDLKVPGFAPFVRPGIRVQTGQVYELGVISPTWLQNTPNAAVVSGKVVVEGGSGDTNGAQVEFVLAGVNQTIALAAVTSSGLFVQRVPPGTYTLRASHPLFVTQVMSDLLLTEGEQKDLSAQPLVMALNPATLTGSVLKEVDGLAAVPAVGALVTFEGSGVTTTTDATGRFSLSGLSGGASSVRLNLAGYHDVVRSRGVRLTPGEASTLEEVTLALDRGDLVGTVRTADGQPVQDATVSIPGTTFATQVVQDPSNASQGSFALRGLPVGPYSVRAAKARYIPAVSALATVAVGSSTSLSAPLTLTVQQGDFEIDDGDPANTPGYSRTASVTLKFAVVAAATYRASEDPAFTGVAFLPYTGSTQPFTLGTTEGTHVVYAQFQDASSNLSATFSSSVVFDSSPPEAPAITINGGAGFTKQPNPLALTLTATEVPGPSVDTVSGLAFVRVSQTAPVGGVLSGTAQVYLRDLPFVPTTLTDGVKTLYAQFIDNAGNTSAVVSASIVVDTVPPQAPSLTIARGAKASLDGYTDSPLVQLQLSAAAEPNGGFVSVRLGNSTGAVALATFGPIQQDVAWFLDPSSQGTKTVSAEFRDAAGNLAVVQTASTVYDSIAPSPVSIATVGGFTVTNVAAVPLTLSAVDLSGLSATGLTLSEDPGFQGTTGQAMPGNGLVTFTLPAGDGPRRIFARFRDVAGNDASASVAVLYDTTAPTGSIEATGTLADGSPSSSRTSSTAISVALTTAGASSYLLGNDTLSACPASAASYTAIPLNTSALPVSLTATPGVRAVKLCLRDEAGNLTGPLTDSLVLDNAAPTGCSVSLSGTLADGVTAAPAGSTAKSQVTATVQGCSSDVVEYLLVNGTAACSATMAGTWSSFAAPSTAAPFLLSGADGPNSVSGCYRDASRNVSALALANITLDATPPAALGITLNDGAAYLGIAQLVGGQPTAKVTATAVGATQWAVSETNPTSFSALQGAPNNTTSLTLSGNGARTVYARFRDDLGNLSAVVSANIIVDTSPPSVVGASFRIETADGGTYINTTSVTLTAAAPSDATVAQVVERSAAGACVPTDYDSASAVSSAGSYVFLLSGGDGNKRVCIRWFDAAGNPSSSLFDTKTLDTRAPNQPFILSSDRVFNPNATGEAAASWVSIVNTADPQHFDWQVLGGQANQWQSTSASAPGIGTPGCTAGLCLRAVLNTSASAESGTQNTIRIRELDQAGNTSGEGSIVLTTDIVPPRPVALSPFWVDNRSTSAIVKWQRLDGGSPDTVGHYVFYSSAPGYPGDGGTAAPVGYEGINAAEGNSPILVGNTDLAVLSSLSNASLAYLTVRPVDRAGNLGATATGTAQIVLQPNEVSPTHIATVLMMTDAGYTGAVANPTLEVVDDMAYVFGGTTGGQSVLQPVSLADMVAPTQGGVIGLGVAPLLLAPAKATDGQTFTGRSGAMVAEPPFLFTAAGNFFRVWSISTPGTPSLISTTDLSAYVSGPLDLNTIEVRGQHVFITGYSGAPILFHLNIGGLYDNTAGFTPTVVTALNTGTVGLPQGNLWSRDRLFFGDGQGATSGWNLANAFAGSPMTVASRFTAGIGWRMNHWRGLSSGNIAIVSESTSLRLLDITSAWSGGSPGFTELARTPLVARGQYQVFADQAFVSEGSYSGLQTANIFDASMPRDTGAVRPAGSTQVATGLAMYGNYALQATEQPSVRAYEVAVPRALHRTLSLGFASGRPTVVPGFVVSASGLVLDMFNSAQRRATPTVPIESCMIDGVVFDDTLVSSRWAFNGSSYVGDLRITRLDDYFGRVASPNTITANSTVVTGGANTRYTGLERYGNYLVVTSARATGGSPATSLWVEVYRANGLRSRATNGARSLSTAAAPGGDKVGEFQYDTTIISHTVYNSKIRMTGPYAVISTRNLGSATAASINLIDLRNLFDDNPATTMSAASIIGKIGKPTSDTFSWSASDAVLKGTTIYAAASGEGGMGLYVFNAADAFDASGATVLNADDRIAYVPQLGANSLDVAGSYAIVTGSTSAATISAYDISSPASPALISETAYTGITLPGDCYSDMATSTVISGSRAYVGSPERFDIVEFE